MLSDATTRKLHEMKLSVMAQAFREQMTGAACLGMAFKDHFRLLVNAEWAARKDNRMARLIRTADYPYPSACVKNIDYLPDNEIVLHRGHVWI